MRKAGFVQVNDKTILSEEVANFLHFCSIADIADLECKDGFLEGREREETDLDIDWMLEIMQRARLVDY